MKFFKPITTTTLARGEKQKKQAALYLRTSTRDGRQHTDNQLAELRSYAAKQDWQVAAIYTEQASGATGPEDRPELARLFADAAVRKFDLVLVWSLDRFSRQKISETFAMLERLKASGCEFWSFKEECFRTTGPVGDMLLAIFAWIARYEQQRIRERILAGMDRAKAAGKKCGRPKAAGGPSTELLEMATQGITRKQMQNTTGLSRATVTRRLREARLAQAGGSA